MQPGHGDDSIAPDGTSRADDCLFCNGSETCQVGVCAGSGDPCGGAPCDEVFDTCDCVFDAECDGGGAGDVGRSTGAEPRFGWCDGGSA